MYEKVNITENHFRALSLFTRGLGAEYYIREVQRLLGISPRTSQLILDDLEKKAVLESRTRGKIRTYGIRKSEAAKDYLVFAEQYKKITFLRKRPMIREVIAKITPMVRGLGMVFGSYAKGVEKKGSDLDVFIAGDYDRHGVKKVSELYGIEISVKSYPMEIFKRDIRKDALIREVLSDHVVFSGAEEFVRTVLENGQD
jgi:predicted nucleotidyltransferase